MHYVYNPEAARPVLALIRAARTMGGYSSLARRLGISRQAVWQWQRCPESRVLEIEALTGVSRFDLRPDKYEDSHDNADN